MFIDNHILDKKKKIGLHILTLYIHLSISMSDPKEREGEGDGERGERVILVPHRKTDWHFIFQQFVSRAPLLISTEQNLFDLQLTSQPATLLQWLPFVLHYKSHYLSLGRWLPIHSCWPWAVALSKNVILNAAT